jgi:putative ATPase
VSNTDLFEFPVGLPLAARMRPKKLVDLLGQDKLTGQSGPLSAYLTKAEILPSLILHGPPGAGKTSLARILADLSERDFIEVSAINSSISDLRDALEHSRNRLEAGKSASILFIDEIHRFGKVQQESLLKALETGEIVLIGATTENPLFALVSALNSRTHLLTLTAINNKDLVSILRNALSSEEGLNNEISADSSVLDSIAGYAAGDARKALTILESSSIVAKGKNKNAIELQDIEQSLASAYFRYDATGDAHYDTISAFIKSVRGSDVDAALHYLARMLVGGEDPRFISRRLAIQAAEDIGLADPGALNLASSVLNIVSLIGMPEGRIPLAELTIYLCLAPKSNSAYLAINAAIADVEEGMLPAIPNYLRSTAAEGKQEKYLYPHDSENGLAKQVYWGADKHYYLAKIAGFEATLKSRQDSINIIRNQP